MTVHVQSLAGRGAAARGPGALRLAVCAATAAACAPYLGIKIAWLSGSTVGWNDAAEAENSVLYVGNAITMGMDAAAVLVACAFTFAWGRRVPAWLVLLPIWVATGLLVPIALAVPLGTLVQALVSAEPATGSGNGLQGWVYGVVYTGFTLQGIGLLTAFVLYARERWPEVFALRTADVQAGPTRPLQVLLARGAAVPAAVCAAVHLFWAFGGTAGLPHDQAVARTAPQQVLDGVWALLALAGAAGLLALAGRARRPARFVVPLAAAWAGAGAMFAWSLYGLVVTLAASRELGADTAPGSGLVALGGVLTGLVIALTGAFLLAEHGGARRRDQSARPMASSSP
ncbi:hypothetical protein [Actinomadura violacea]|uniref:LigA protein n=1 Tax=Actinomadura violacea TaxID=2819934 RepID=A0ABS3RUT0_9ACTN|nr:hypothetical protein [Actinomadura violacea]MBO2459775.1 hypothetical protein [Actinomadura violacea]